MKIFIRPRWPEILVIGFLIVAILMVFLFLLPKGQPLKSEGNLTVTSTHSIKSFITYLKLVPGKPYTLEIDESGSTYSISVDSRLIYSTLNEGNKKNIRCNKNIVFFSESENAVLVIDGNFPSSIKISSLDDYLNTLVYKIFMQLILTCFVFLLLIQQLYVFLRKKDKVSLWFIVLSILVLIQTYYSCLRYLPRDFKINYPLVFISEFMGYKEAFTLFNFTTIVLLMYVLIKYLLDYFEVDAKVETKLLCAVFILAILLMFIFVPLSSNGKYGYIAFCTINIIGVRSALVILFANYKKKSGGKFILIGSFIFNIFGFLQLLSMKYMYTIGTITFLFFIMLSNIKAYEEAVISSNFDFLTGLANKKYFYSVGQRLFMQSKFNDYSVGLAVIDIDHFKRINDTYGHDTGDIILKNVADTIKKAIRVTDIAARYGGEEFTVLFLNSSLENSLMVAERIRKAVEESKVYSEKFGILQCTVSIGVSCSVDKNSLQDIFTDSDQNLYKAKNSGRNKVCPTLS